MKSLGEIIGGNAHVNKLLHNDAVLVPCNYFNKDTTNNWYVTRHRDLSIPVVENINFEQWSGWNTKKGTIYAQPPRQLLQSLLIVRIRLEHDEERNGALRVVPGSHLDESSKPQEVICQVKKDGALLMRPLLLHKSPKAQQGARRALHFVFGPHDLPDGAEWSTS